jgi:D-alanine-D-alanine ligase
LRTGFTFNIKKEIDDNIIQAKLDEKKNFIDDNLTQNYTHRISDIYAEWDEQETIDAVADALSKAGHEVIRIEADENIYTKLKIIRPDIVFNIAEGIGGASRESYVPFILEMLNIPYSASDPLTIGNCHDKSRCKEILSYYNIPTPGFFIASQSVNGFPKVKYPAFVKPLHEGSSKGIYNSSLVTSNGELNREIQRIWDSYQQPSIIEDYLDGREFTVAVLGNGENVRILPIIEINMNDLPIDFPKIYSYEVKWFFDTRENKLDIFTCPAEISNKLKNRIEKICLDAYKALRIRDWARIDVRCDSDENPFIIEVNPLPGILPNPDDNSCFPKAAREAGMCYEALIQTVLNLAAERYGLHK